MKIERSTYATPIGRLNLAVHAGKLLVCCFEEHWEAERRILERWHGLLDIQEGEPPRPIQRCLDAYFAGKLDALDNIPVDPVGTAFQRKVWAALRRVPAGKTASYLELAKTVGCDGGARAVGAANGANPVCLVIPCHRIIRADGSLCGYGAGVHRKEWLLRHEGVLGEGTRAARPA
jgi:methylated-DNA-[protein]-cysteine S-methyltransferase